VFAVGILLVTSLISTFFSVAEVDEFVDVFILSSMFLTWPESSEPDEIESVSFAAPSRDEELCKQQK
jgi:hypothetical protein